MTFAQNSRGAVLFAPPTFASYCAYGAKETTVMFSKPPNLILPKTITVNSHNPKQNKYHHTPFLNITIFQKKQWSCNSSSDIFILCLPVWMVPSKTNMFDPPSQHHPFPHLETNTPDSEESDSAETDFSEDFSLPESSCLKVRKQGMMQQDGWRSAHRCYR